jgi:hypothetical protein
MRSGWSAAILLWVVVAVCAAGQVEQDGRAVSPGVEIIGRIEHEPLAESSGIIASRQHEGIFWTHNDSGHPAVLFAITRTGELVAELPVAARNVDWEDIAIDGQGRLYIGDIGNNRRDRTEIAVHRLEEPDPRAPAAAGERLAVERTWRLRYPDRPFDAEALFIHEDHGYIISKLMPGRPAGLYRFPLDARDGATTLEGVAEVPVRMPVTAADISADGQRLAVLSVGGLHVFEIDGKPEAVAKAAVRHVRYLHPMIEAACFVEDGVLVTAESREVFLFRVEDRVE